MSLHPHLRRGRPCFCLLFAFALVIGATGEGARAAVEPTPVPPVASPAAASPEAKAIANQRLEDGVRAFRQGRFSDALASFEKAREAYPSPQLWFDIAQSHKELGQDVEALRAFSRFRDEALEASPALRAEALTNIDALQRKLARLSLHTTMVGDKVLLDDKVLGPSPRDEEIWVTPGTHVVVVRSQSGALLFRKELDVQAGARPLIIATPSGTPPAPVAAVPASPALDLTAKGAETSPPATLEPPFYRRPVFWIVTGAVVLLAAGATTWLLLRPADRCDEINCV